MFLLRKRMRQNGASYEQKKDNQTRTIESDNPM